MDFRHEWKHEINASDMIALTRAAIPRALSTCCLPAAALAWLRAYSIGLLATNNLPMPVLALLMPVAYIVLLKVPLGTAFNAWTGQVPWLFMLTAVILMFPGIDVVNPGELGNIRLPFVFFITACLSIGAVSSYVGFGMVSFRNTVLYNCALPD